MKRIISAAIVALTISSLAAPAFAGERHGGGKGGGAHAMGGRGGHGGKGGFAGFGGGKGGAAAVIGLAAGAILLDALANQ
jgi:hypothetical protein